MFGGYIIAKLCDHLTDIICDGDLEMDYEIEDYQSVTAWVCDVPEEVTDGLIEEVLLSFLRGTTEMSEHAILKEIEKFMGAMKISEALAED